MLRTEPKFTCHRDAVAERPTVKDLIFVVVGVAFFAASWLYAMTFDRI